MGEPEYHPPQRSTSVAASIDLSSTRLISPLTIEKPRHQNVLGGADTYSLTKLMPYHFPHPQLGKINGFTVAQSLVQFRGLPYGRVPQRFARSIPVNYLSPYPSEEPSGYDATEYGPCSVQPLDSIITDVHWNQLPEYPQ